MITCEFFFQSRIPHDRSSSSSRPSICVQLKLFLFRNLLTCPQRTHLAQFCAARTLLQLENNDLSTARSFPRPLSYGSGTSRDHRISLLLRLDLPRDLVSRGLLQSRPLAARDWAHHFSREIWASDQEAALPKARQDTSLRLQMSSLEMSRTESVQTVCSSCSDQRYSHFDDHKRCSLLWWFEVLASRIFPRLA